MQASEGLSQAVGPSAVRHHKSALIEPVPSREAEQVARRKQEQTVEAEVRSALDRERVQRREARSPVESGVPACAKGRRRAVPRREAFPALEEEKRAARELPVAQERAAPSRASQAP